MAKTFHQSEHHISHTFWLFVVLQMHLHKHVCEDKIWASDQMSRLITVHP